MAVGMSTATANSILNAIGNATAYSLTNVYVKLHTADPGAAGTTAAATETTRKVVSFGAASGGSMQNDTAITWTGIAGSQDATHFSLWDDVSAGNFVGSGTITAAAYTAGDTYTVAIGGCTLSLTVAS
jgi:hypothetical protein